MLYAVLFDSILPTVELLSKLEPVLSSPLAVGTICGMLVQYFLT
jgi:hypothetical protein